MTYEEYINEIEDFDDITKQELLLDFQNFISFDNPSIQQQMGYHGFQNSFQTQNNTSVMQLGESIRGMNNVSPLVEMKMYNQKSKDISDKYFIDAFKYQYDDFDIVVDSGCTVNEEYLRQNFKKHNFNYFIDDDGKKGFTEGDREVNFVIFISKDENKIKEAYQCLEPSKNEIILFIEDNTGDNNEQLILAKADTSVKKVFKQVNQKMLNDYKPFHDMQGILKLEYKDWIALILNGRLEGNKFAVEDVIGSLSNVIKIFFLPSKALGWILNKIGDGIDYLKIPDTIWDTQSDDYFFEKNNITNFFTVDTAPLAELKKAVVNDPNKIEWNDLLPSFISENAEIYIDELENVIGKYNTYITRQIEAIYSFQQQVAPVIDILNIKESIAFWVGMWNGLVDFISSIFKFAGMILEAPFEIFDNFDKVVDWISQLFSSLSNIDISDELVKAYANIKKYLSEKDSGDVDWIRVAYISGFGLMFILTFFIPYANIAKLASIGKFGKFGVIIADVLEGTGKALGKVTQAVTQETKDLAKDIWKALTSLVELLKHGGAKLKELFEKISKAIVDWFFKNKDKYVELVRYGKALLKRTAETYAKKYPDGKLYKILKLRQAYQLYGKLGKKLVQEVDIAFADIIKVKGYKEKVMVSGMLYKGDKTQKVFTAVNFTKNEIQIEGKLTEFIKSMHPVLKKRYELHLKEISKGLNAAPEMIERAGIAASHGEIRAINQLLYYLETTGVKVTDDIFKDIMSYNKFLIKEGSQPPCVHCFYLTDGVQFLKLLK